jgi:hypothetical protein
LGILPCSPFRDWLNNLNFTFLIQWQQNFQHLTRV